MEGRRSEGCEELLSQQHEQTRNRKGMKSARRRDAESVGWYIRWLRLLCTIERVRKQDKGSRVRENGVKDNEVRDNRLTSTGDNKFIQCVDSGMRRRRDHCDVCRTVREFLPCNTQKNSFHL